MQSEYAILAQPQLIERAINLAQLARDLALDLDEPDDIRKAHGLTDHAWEKILQEPHFQRMLGEMIGELRSMSGTPERIKVKAALAVEASIETFLEDIKNRNYPLGQRVEAIKALARLGELGMKDAIGGGTVGGAVQININLGTPGEGRPPKIINAIATPVLDEELLDEQS